jgi:HK97 gp10 family phage protein
MMASFAGVPVQSGVGGGVASNVTIIGIRELAAKLALVNRIAHAELGLMMKGVADHMYKAAKEHVPVVTGNLQQGIQMENAGPYNWSVSASSLAGHVAEKNSKEYAGFVEFGTSKMAPRSFMTTAYAETGPIVQSNLVRVAARLEAL